MPLKLGSCKGKKKMIKHIGKNSKREEKARKRGPLMKVNVRNSTLFDHFTASESEASNLSSKVLNSICQTKES